MGEQCDQISSDLLKKKERTPFTLLDTGKHAYCTQTNIHIQTKPLKIHN